MMKKGVKRNIFLQKKGIVYVHNVFHDAEYEIAFKEPNKGVFVVQTAEGFYWNLTKRRNLNKPMYMYISERVYNVLNVL